MKIELEKLKYIVAKNCPIFHLHSEEQYYPCSAEYFIESSQLHVRHADGTHRILVSGTESQEPLNASLLLDYQKKHPDSTLWMHLDPAKRKGEHHRLSDVPVYAQVKAVVVPDKQETITNKHQHRYEALEINYITLFAYNGAYTVAGCIQTGAHDGDIEHITARVDPVTGSLIAMWYNSHRSRDGEWLPSKDVEICLQNNRYKAYIALNGHGNYPKAGTIPRHFFLGNDRCDEKGEVWAPRTIVLLPRRVDNDSVDVCDGEKELDGIRRLMTCPSRGCNFIPCTNDTANYTTKDIDDMSDDIDCTVVEQKRNRILDIENIHVITEDACEWVYFKGEWGETAAMRQQSWFHTAETPVSRNMFKRLFLHVWPETDHLSM